MTNIVSLGLSAIVAGIFLLPGCAVEADATDAEEQDATKAYYQVSLSTTSTDLLWNYRSRFTAPASRIGIQPDHFSRSGQSVADSFLVLPGKQVRLTNASSTAMQFKVSTLHHANRDLPCDAALTNESSVTLAPGASYTTRTPSQTGDLLSVTFPLGQATNSGTATRNNSFRFNSSQSEASLEVNGTCGNAW
jgi:hypothetical protein